MGSNNKFSGPLTAELFTGFLQYTPPQNGISADNFYQVDKWNHIAVTYDGLRVRAYLNSEFKARSNISTNSPFISSSGGLYIGNQIADHTEFFKGSVDDFRIYNRALSAEEIQLLYQAEAELPEQSVASAKLSPALSDLIDGNGSLEQALPAGSVIARKPGEDPPTDIHPFPTQ